jgi:hypothetical protein
LSLSCNLCICAGLHGGLGSLRKPYRWKPYRCRGGVYPRPSQAGNMQPRSGGDKPRPYGIISFWIGP